MPRVLYRTCVFHFSFGATLADSRGNRDKTINAEFVIDPVRNRGLDFQYDEVVRTKEDRRRMDAGDCECCRDVRPFSFSYACTNANIGHKQQIVL